MKKLVVELYRGLFETAYSNSTEPLDIQVIDDDDRYDEERAADYHRIKRLIECGCLTDIYNGRQTAQEKQNTVGEEVCSMLDPEAFLLVPEEWKAKTEHGKLLQKLDMAFIDGFLNAWGRLDRFIFALDRSVNAEDREKGSLLLEYLEPVRSKMDRDYTAFCEKVLQAETYDRAEEKDDENIAEPDSSLDEHDPSLSKNDTVIQGV